MAVGNGTLLGVNLVDNYSSITSDATPVGDFDVINLANHDPDLTWKSPAADLTVLQTITLDRERPLSGVVLSGHNLSYTGEIKVRIEDDLAATIYDSGWFDAHLPLYAPFWDNPFEHGVFGEATGDVFDKMYRTTSHYFTQVLGSKILLDIRDETDNDDNYLTGGYFMAGDFLTPEVNFEWGSGVAFLPQIETLDTPSGGTLSYRNGPKRGGTITWEWLSEVEAMTLQQIVLVMQSRKLPVFWSAYPGNSGPLEAQQSLVAEIVDSTGPISLPGGFWRYVIVVEEVQF